MNKTWIYVLIVLLLGAGAWFMLNKEDKLVVSPDADFTVKDTSAIGKIFIARPSGEALKLVKTKEGWILNDSFKARKASLSQFFYVLYRQEAMQPVSTKMHNDIVKNIATQGIKVELYKNDGQHWKTFYVGGEVPNTHGSFMMMQGAPQPYVVQIPNHNGYLAAFYEPVIKEWRDRGLIAVKQEDIKEVNLQYFDHPERSFKYKKDGESIMVEGTQPDMRAENLNKKRAYIYSGFFDYVNAEVYMNGEKGLDSVIAHTKKLGRLTVTDTKDKSTSIDLFWMPVHVRSKNIDNAVPGVPEGFDGDRYYAVINNGKDTVMVQKITFDKILRDGKEFFMPEYEASQNAAPLPANP